MVELAIATAIPISEWAGIDDDRLLATALAVLDDANGG